MKIVKSRKSAVDGFIFECATRACRTYSHIRSVSMYSISHITIMEITKTIFHYFVRNYNARQAVLDMKEIIHSRLSPLLASDDDLYLISYRAVQKMYRMVRRQIHMYTQNLYRRVKLGKYGRAIEIDESIFATVTREGQKHKVWVLGFYERGTKEARAIHVKDRTEETLT